MNKRIGLSSLILGFAVSCALSVPIATLSGCRRSDDHINSSTQSPLMRQYGDRNAPVQMDMYFSYADPFSKMWIENEFPQIMADYVNSGKVFVTLRDFPLTSIHPQSLEAAIMGRESALLDTVVHGALMTDLFNNQSTWVSASTPQQLYAIAQAHGIDPQTTNRGAHIAEINKDKNAGQTIGVMGVPYFQVRSKKLPPELITGAQPYNAFKIVIDAHL